MRRRNACAAVLVLMIVAGASAAEGQTAPQPFPRPSAPRDPAPPPPAPSEPAVPPPPAIESGTLAPPAADAPTEAMLGVPIFAGSQFLQSYDAGRGQRYYLYGTNSGFVEVVAFYRTTLKERGTLVFDAPAIHMFEVGRFREQTMAFPPGVTVKDYAWNGSAGYLHVKEGLEPVRYRTVVQIVPVVPEGR